MGDRLQFQSPSALPAGGAQASGILGVQMADELFAQIRGPLLRSGMPVAATLITAPPAPRT